jgi:hypothetical protein
MLRRMLDFLLERAPSRRADRSLLEPGRRELATARVLGRFASPHEPWTELL